MPANVSQAAAFRYANRDYFFEDAHFLVEAEATTVAVEVRPNVFRFPDGSLLIIDRNRCSVDVKEPEQACA